MTPRNRRNEPDLPSLADDVLLALHQETANSIVDLVQFNSRLCAELRRRHLFARALDGFSAQYTEPDAPVVRQATDDEQRAALTLVARRAVDQGAGHDCHEWTERGRCTLCGREVTP